MTAQRLLSDADVPGYLRELGLASAGEPILLTPAGDGNINWVRRVSIGGERTRSLVLKQARSALERFPQYSAPTERLLCEARWLELAAPYDSDAVCPRVLALDAENRVLALEASNNSEASSSHAMNIPSNNPNVTDENARSEKPLSISSTPMSSPPRPKPIMAPNAPL